MSEALSAERNSAHLLRGGGASLSAAGGSFQVRRSLHSQFPLFRNPFFIESDFYSLINVVSRM